jgi:hypothetical protein
LLGSELDIDLRHERQLPLKVVVPPHHDHHRCTHDECRASTSASASGTGSSCLWPSSHSSSNRFLLQGSLT